MSFMRLVAQALATKGLSIAKGAKKARITYPAFAAVAKGQALPNARTIPKYAKFLGIPAGDLASLIQEEKNMPNTKKSAKKAKKAKKSAKKAKKSVKKGAKKAAKKKVAKKAKKAKKGAKKKVAKKAKKGAKKKAAKKAKKAKKSARKAK